MKRIREILSENNRYWSGPSGLTRGPTRDQTGVSKIHRVVTMNRSGFQEQVSYNGCGSLAV